VRLTGVFSLWAFIEAQSTGCGISTDAVVGVMVEVLRQASVGGLSAIEDLIRADGRSNRRRITKWNLFVPAMPPWRAEDRGQSM
jgi:hypothetical protein